MVGDVASLPDDSLPIFPHRTICEHIQHDRNPEKRRILLSSSGVTAAAVTLAVPSTMSAYAASQTLWQGDDVGTATTSGYVSICDREADGNGACAVPRDIQQGQLVLIARRKKAVGLHGVNGDAALPEQLGRHHRHRRLVPRAHAYRSHCAEALASWM
ncbi:hypothetical protein [Streptomyces mutabilis]|uniref:hypothetical protein n=1 Tax=Streptomyces mutabilis TaxID=67332 RepID=UPI00369D03A5